MPNDNQTEEVVLSQENNTEDSTVTGEVGVTDTTSTETQEEVDYRGKLNATNSFLKKEGYEFKDGKWVKDKVVTKQERKNVNSNNSTSTTDLMALMNAKVAEEDVGEVEEMAKFKGISIAEALRTDTVKAILALKAEQRNTAAATNVGNSRRSGSKVTDESLLESASKGNLPESDADINRLLVLKMKKK